jgi:hypothetical protein
MKVDKGDWVDWEKSCTYTWSRNSIYELSFKSKCWKGKNKEDAKDMCNFALVIKVLIH